MPGLVLSSYQCDADGDRLGLDRRGVGRVCHEALLVMLYALVIVIRHGFDQHKAVEPLTGETLHLRVDPLDKVEVFECPVLVFPALLGRRQRFGYDMEPYPNVCRSCAP